MLHNLQQIIGQHTS